jgi:hypothetical protein
MPAFPGLSSLLWKGGKTRLDLEDKGSAERPHLALTPGVGGQTRFAGLRSLLIKPIVHLSETLRLKIPPLLVVESELRANARLRLRLSLHRC